MNIRPNWPKWKHVPHVRLWEGVALSLDVEPGQVEANAYALIEGQLYARDWEEFRNRLFVATRNLHRALKAKGPNGDHPEECMVSRSEFAAWVISVEWKIPDEFASLAESQRTPTQRDDKREVPELTTRERQTAYKLILGMALGGYGYDPKAKRSTTVTEIVADLAQRGISITDDTARKWLKEAAAEVEWQPASDQC
jgi:hypothetical protein